MITHHRDTVRSTPGLIMAAAAVIGVIALAVPVTAQSLSLRAVRDPENRFTIAVPASWNVHTQTKNPSVEAKSPGPASKATPPDSLDVIVYDMPHAITPQACIGASDIVLRFAIHNWTTVKEGPVTVAGQPGYSRVYDWKTGGGALRRSVQTCVTNANRAFMAVGTTDSTPAKVASTLPLLQRSIATLQPNLKIAPAPATGPEFGNH